MHQLHQNRWNLEVIRAERFRLPLFYYLLFMSPRCAMRMCAMIKILYFISQGTVT